jgi:hypothetical protein
MKNEVSWQLFPKSTKAPDFLISTVEAFNSVESTITSDKTGPQTSNEALAIVRPGLESLGYQVERGKLGSEKIQVPVLYGQNGKIEKSFEADAYWPEKRVVLEVEAGRGVTNYQFLKDFFQACVMQDVDWLVIAVRKTYRDSKDFQKVVQFFETLYASSRLLLPLRGILVIGY